MGQKEDIFRKLKTSLSHESVGGMQRFLAFIAEENKKLKTNSSHKKLRTNSSMGGCFILHQFLYREVL